MYRYQRRPMHKSQRPVQKNYRPPFQRVFYYRRVARKRK